MNNRFDCLSEVPELDQARGRAAWEKAIAALDVAVATIRRLESLDRAGKPVTYLLRRAQGVADSAQRLLDQIIQIVSANDTLKNVIDTLASTAVPTTGLSDLRVGAWKEVVAEMRRPTPLPGLAFLGPLVQGVGRVLTSPVVWTGVKEVLIKLGPWIGGSLVTSNVMKTVQGDAASTEARTEQLETCLQLMEQAKTPEEVQRAQQLCETPSNGGWFLLLGAVGAGALVYWQSRNAQSGVSLSGRRRGRRRR